MRDGMNWMPAATPPISVIVLSLIIALPCFSQEQTPDTLRQRDSVTVVRMPLHPGAVDRTRDSSSYLTPRDLNFMDQRYIGDVLLAFPAVYVRDQGSEGQYNQVNVRGVDWRSVAFLVNGRTMNDPASGILNPYYLAPEIIDRLEFIPGPRAFLYGFGSAGGTVNIVPKYFWSARPMTRIDFMRGPYTESLVDGMYSQNVLRNLNFMFGFQYQGTDGRYVNAESEAWNARTQIRYAPLHDLTLVFSDFFTSTNTDMNGGIDVSNALTLDPFNPYLATPRNSDSYEKVTRHDVDLSLFGSFLGDSTDATSLSLYYSHALREYRDEENRSQPNGLLVMSDHTSSWMGATLLQHLTLGFQSLSIGGTMELRQIEGSPNLGRRRNSVGAVWAKDEAHIGELLTVAAYARYESFLGNQSLGYGGDIRVAIGGGSSLYAGASGSRRPPNYAELFWSDSALAGNPYTRSEQHADVEIGGEFRFGEGNSLTVSYFRRLVQDPVVYRYAGTLGSGVPAFEAGNGATSTGYGGEARFSIRVWVLEAEGAGAWLRFAEEPVAQEALYPELSGRAGLFYRNLLLDGGLDLKCGFRVRFSSSSTGAVFDQGALAYLPNRGVALERGASVDFSAVAHIGEAYVHILWENLTEARYFTTPYYPVRDRNIRFGISWTFLD